MTTSERIDAEIAALEAEIAVTDAEIAALEAENAALKAARAREREIMNKVRRHREEHQGNPGWLRELFGGDKAKGCVT
jgi:cell division protein FtsB